jgi:hypothetical protein
VEGFNGNIFAIFFWTWNIHKISLGLICSIIAIACSRFYRQWTAITDEHAQFVIYLCNPQDPHTYDIRRGVIYIFLLLVIVIHFVLWAPYDKMILDMRYHKRCEQLPENYVVRSDLDIILKEMKSNYFMVVTGPVGVGKSTINSAICEQMNNIWSHNEEDFAKAIKKLTEKAPEYFFPALFGELVQKIPWLNEFLPQYSWLIRTSAEFIYQSTHEKTYILIDGVKSSDNVDKHIFNEITKLAGGTSYLKIIFFTTENIADAIYQSMSTLQANRYVYYVKGMKKSEAVDYLFKSFNGLYNHDSLNIIVNNITGTRPFDLYYFMTTTKDYNLLDAIQQFNKSFNVILDDMYQYLVEQNMIPTEDKPTVDIMQHFMMQYLDTNGCTRNIIPIQLMRYFNQKHMFTLRLKCLWNNILVNILQGYTINDDVYNAVIKTQGQKQENKKTTQKTEI